MCFLVHRVRYRSGLGAIHRQDDQEQRDRGVCDERQHDRLARLARRVRRLEERRRRLRVERERRFAKAPRRARGVREVDEPRARNEAQFAAAKQRADGTSRDAGGASHFIDREDFLERTLGH